MNILTRVLQRPTVKNVTYVYTLIFFIVSIVYFATLSQPAYVNNSLVTLTNINQLQWMYFVSIYQMTLFGLIIFVLLSRRFIDRRIITLIMYVMFIIAVLGFLGLFIAGTYIYANTPVKTNEFQIMFALFMAWTALLVLNVCS